jgi:hypothetical protein
MSLIKIFVTATRVSAEEIIAFWQARGYTVLVNEQGEVATFQDQISGAQEAWMEDVDQELYVILLKKT